MPDDISLSKIESYLFCGHAYRLDTFMKQDGLPITGFEAKTAWLKNSFRKLLPEEKYIGTDLMPLEDLRGEELAAALAYHSAEAFGNATMMMWREHVIENQGKARGRNVVWAYPNHWQYWNKWQKRHEISHICKSYYSYLLQEGIPLSDLRDTDAAFYSAAENGSSGQAQSGQSKSKKRMSGKRSSSSKKSP